MNLIDNRWLKVIRANGEKDRIAPWQIAEKNNPIVEIDAHRHDFRGSLYQFLIGLLQTAYAPEDQEVWFEYWEEMPDVTELKMAFTAIAPAFELFSDDVAFLQDFDLPEGEQKPISGLLIEAPGGKTLKDNLDHFVKGGMVGGVCDACVATALFTLQTNAPSGGVGHRVGLRGGGPLTTLVLPNDSATTLWKKLWLNVLTQEEIGVEGSLSSSIFPWLAPTRFSDKSGKNTLPDDTHPLQMYWGMPRRIRLQKDQDGGCCTLCGDQSETLTSHFITKNYGVNYEGPWLHPLTPYRKDPKNTKPPLSLKGQQGGLGYRHWLGLTLQDPSNGDGAAQVVQSWQEKADNFFEVKDEAMRLWCFGFDMDNMKARCWYDHQMPVFSVEEEYRDVLIDLVGEIISAAKDVVYILRSQVKEAWFSEPNDVKGDTTMIDYAFWQATEGAFYQHLQTLIASRPNPLPPEIAKQWLSLLRKTAVEQFDYWVLEGDEEDLDMRRIFISRKTLFAKLKTAKSLKQLAKTAGILDDQKGEPEIS